MMKSQTEGCVEVGVAEEEARRRHHPAVAHVAGEAEEARHHHQGVAHVAGEAEEARRHHQGVAHVAGEAGGDHQPVQVEAELPPM